MILGARQGVPSPLRRLLALAIARDLSAVVIPGIEVARAHGLDIEATGIRIAATARHASVLIVIGDIPIALRDAAAVIYVQMPRPRILLSLGAATLFPLPVADIAVGLSQRELVAGVSRLGRVLAKGAFRPAIHVFDAAILHGEIEYSCPMHPEIVQDEPGSCPKCGMNLVPQNIQIKPEHNGMDMSHPKKNVLEAVAKAAGQTEGGSLRQAHTEPAHEHKTDHAMAFMSMVDVTKDLPRSADGLPMDWSEVPFGPFFPGLPGGLLLIMTLDGDSVAKLSVRTLVGSPALLQGSSEAAADFVERLTRFNPLTPVAYRLLAYRALEQAGGRVIDFGTARKRVGALERERITSHLSWIAELGRQIGFDWLTQRACALQLRFMHADMKGLLALDSALAALLKGMTHAPLLKSRLTGVGLLARVKVAYGPVARASGIQNDARMADDTYSVLGFRPILREKGDAFERLGVRLAETVQSLQLIKAAGAVDASFPADFGTVTGEGYATVETPRGLASLRLTVDGGRVVAVQLDSPSTQHLALLHPMTMQHELGDALVAASSLDISPWEIMQ
ncbi:MAG: NADH-quinone oxidoreductase subunit D-related protein [Sulfuriferula sp.]